jgi:branched-chain amino acid transport system substrate-binding protein
MKRSMMLIAMLLAAVLTLVAVGCGGSKATTTTAAPASTGTTAVATSDTTAAVQPAGGPGVDTAKKEIKIAVLGPMTGGSAEYGKSQERGAKTFTKLELPLAAGAYKDYTFSYEFFDGKADPKEAANIAQQIVMGNYYAVVGSSLSLESLAAAPILDRKSITIYTTFSASSKLTSSGWKNVVMSFPIAQQEGAAGADIVITKMGKKKVVEFYENSPYGQGLHEGFVARVKELGGEVIKSYTNDAKADVDFSAPITEIKGLTPDAIFLSETYEPAGVIMGQLRKAGVEVPIAACSGALDKTAVEMAGGEAAVTNVQWLSLFSPESSRPKVQAFVKEYEAENAALVPDDAAALTYDSLVGIKTALENGVVAREDLAAKLRGGSLPAPEGITNPAIKHDATGNIVGSQLIIIIYKNGKFQLAPGQ